MQYKNNAKDKEAVERDYLRLGYSVIWTTQTDYTDDRCLLDHQDIIDSVTPVWPNAIPRDSAEWMDWQYDGFDLKEFLYLQARWKRDAEVEYIDSYQRATMAYQVEFVAPTLTARLPPDWCDEQAQQLWESKDWLDLLNPPARQDQYYIEEVLTEQDQDQLESPEMEVVLPPEWWEQIEQEIWETYPWEHFFDTPRQDKVLIEEAFDVMDAERSWSLKVDVPFIEFVDTGKRDRARIRQVLYPAWKAGAKEYLPEEKPTDPPRPENPFDDLQCRECGTHWHFKRDDGECPNCETPVDYEWNWATGRISDEIYETIGS